VARFIVLIDGSGGFVLANNIVPAANPTQKRSLHYHLDCDEVIELAGVQALDLLITVFIKVVWEGREKHPLRPD
jgi:hypothetical protein